MKNTFFKKLVFLIPSLFLIASCSDFLGGIQTDDGNDTNAGTDSSVVTFNITSSRSPTGRTALPSVDFEKYVYSITASCEARGIVDKVLADNLTIGNLSGHKFSMVRAVWIFKVIAYEKTNKEKPVFEGNSESVDLVKTSAAQVNMVLRATTGGSGTVKIPVTYDKAGVAKVTAGLYTDPTGTTLAEDVDGNPFSEQVFTSDSGITKNDDGTYSLTYNQDNIPSGQTYYARISMYDKNGVCVGTYTEAVYVAEGLESTPVIYAKNDDGTYKQDENGNFIEETEPEKQNITMQADLYTATVAAEAGKTVIVQDANGNSYTLSDEDGDGVYDGELPPGDYKVKIGDTPEEAEQAEPNEDVTLDVGSKEVVSDSLMLKEVQLTENAVVGATLETKAFAKIGTDITEKVSLQWFSGEDTDEDGEPDSEWEKIPDAIASTYKLSPSDEGKFFKIVATQEFSGETVTKEAVSSAVEKGTLATDYIITYDEKLSVTVVKGSAEATVKSEKLSVSNVTDTEGNEIDAAVTFIGSDGKTALSEKTLEASESVIVEISADGYISSKRKFYITVEAAEPTIALSTDSVNIVDGMVAFESALEGAVYSTDGGENWKPVTTAPFTPPAEEGKILVKMAAVGSAGAEGYIAESKTEEIAVAEANLGTRIEAIAENGVTITGTAKVGETLEVSVLGENETDLTECVTYKWYASDSEDGEGIVILGATKNSFTVSPAQDGKFIYVTATQTNPKTQAEQTVSSARTAQVSTGGLDDTELTISYSGTVIAGNAPSKENLETTGTLKDGANGVEISQSAQAGDGGYALSVPGESLNSSGKITVTITAAGYESITKDVFVTVQAKIPDVKLSEDSVNIVDGMVAFESALEGAVYSTDGGESWKPVTTAPFTPPAEEGKILVKTVAIGTEGEEGYIAESDSIEISVTNENLGTKIEAIAENGVTVTGTAKVGESLGASVLGVQGTNLTETVAYQWYASDSETGEGTAINGATEKAFILTPAEAGKFVYVAATQTNLKTQATQTVSSYRTGAVANGALNDSGLSISYTEVILAGTSPSAEKLAAQGTLKGGSNNAEVTGYALSVPNTALTSSCYVTVTITAAGYESITKEVFVIVQANAPETDGLLSTEKANITSGYIKFASADSTLEYTVDGGTTWLSVSTEEFKKPESLKIRKKAVDGTPDANENPVGYIKESAGASVTVSDDNVGIKVAAKGAQIVVEPFGDIKIEKTESEGTITLTAATGFTDYSWEIDGTALTGTGTTGFAVDGGVLTITTANLEKGTYQITVNGTKNGIICSTGISVKVE